MVFQVTLSEYLDTFQGASLRYQGMMPKCAASSCEPGPGLLPLGKTCTHMHTHAHTHTHTRTYFLLDLKHIQIKRSQRQKNKLHKHAELGG